SITRADNPPSGGASWGEASRGEASRNDASRRDARETSHEPDPLDNHGAAFANRDEDPVSSSTGGPCESHAARGHDAGSGGARIQESGAVHRRAARVAA